MPRSFAPSFYRSSFTYSLSKRAALLQAYAGSILSTFYSFQVNVYASSGDEKGTQYELKKAPKTTEKKSYLDWLGQSHSLVEHRLSVFSAIVALPLFSRTCLSLLFLSRLATCLRRGSSLQALFSFSCSFLPTDFFERREGEKEDRLILAVHRKT